MGGVTLVVNPDAPVYKKSIVTKFPFYYGWFMLIGSLIVLVLSTPGQTIGVSVFVDDIINSLNSTRPIISTCYTLATVGAGIVYPFIGPVIDKMGARYGGMLSALCLGIGCLILAWSYNIGVLFLSFVIIRTFGQGALAMSATYAVNQWFVRIRGRAVGIVQTANSLLMFAVFPVVATWASERYGWRDVYFWCAIGGEFLIAIPVCYGFLRDKPEVYGLRPDGAGKLSESGDASPLVASPAAAPGELRLWTRKEALSTLIFWAMGLSIGIVAMIVTGFLFHMTDIVKSIGMAGYGPSVLMSYGIACAAFTFIGGVVVEKLGPVALMTMTHITMTLACLLVPLLKHRWEALVWGAVVGAAMGGLTGVLSTAWAVLFGRPNLAAITSPATTIIMFGTAVGPLPFAVWRSSMGDYNGISLITAIVPVLFAILLNYAWRHHDNSAPPPQLTSVEDPKEGLTDQKA